MGTRSACLRLEARLTTVDAITVHDLVLAALVRISEIDRRRGDLVQLLTGPRQLDDVENFGAAEAGDLHGSHAGEARAEGWLRAASVSRS